MYRPLDVSKQEIRVLNLAKQVDSQNRLVGALETISLKRSFFNKPKYEALSWCWGDLEGTPKEIVLDDQVTLISQNAEQVLRRVCYDQEHWRVWIDAVCINQNNDVEKAQQIAHMQKVYSQAKRVLIWLGEDEGTTEAAVASIETILDQMRQVVNNNDSRLDTLFWTNDGNEVLSNEPLPNCEWEAVAQFYSAPWFSRLWVIQEAMLAREWMYHRCYQRAEHVGRLLSGVTNAAQIWRYQRRPYDVTALMLFSAHLRSRKEHDRIYGLLGLLQSRNMPQNIVVDYSQDLRDVYAQATRLALVDRAGQPHQLYILELAQALVPSPKQNPEVPDGWPSWVPKYHWTFDTDQGSTPFTRVFGNGAANGSAGRIDRPRGGNSSSILSVQGVTVDRVRAIGQVLSEGLLDDEPELATEILTCKALASGCNSSEFALTLTSGQTEGHGDASVSSSFKRCYQEFSNQCKQQKGAQIWSDPKASRFANAVVAGSKNRRFFTTAKGYIGMGPPGMREGDHVCILFGGESPFVLRRAQDENWLLVGVAYMHAIMNGRYVRGLDAAGHLRSETSTFHIC